MFNEIIDIETGLITQVELTTEEIAEIEAKQIELSAKINSYEVEQEAKAEAKAALLSKLGITENEAKLLLG